MNRHVRQGEEHARSTRVRELAGRFWFSVLFSMQRRAPWFLERLRPLAVQGGWRCSQYMREAVLQNARHLLPPNATQSERTEFGKRVLSSFFDFVREMGNQAPLLPETLEHTIRNIHGAEQYASVRSAHTGAILLTAHLGAYESAIAVLRQKEQRVHVVFRRDEFSGFERLRAAQRKRLGVIEAPVDDGIANWIRLRDALQNDDVVLLQGDRVLPGQSGTAVPFFDGYLMMPTGPAKLAMASGAPIVPVFSPRTGDGRIDLYLEDPIFVDASIPTGDAVERAMSSIAPVIERFVRQFPDQWLMIHRAWCDEDGHIE